MKVAIVKKDDSKSLEAYDEIISYLSNSSLFSLDDETPDLVIAIGGDGTFLSAFRKYSDLNEWPLFMGINTGTIGCYNDFSVDEAIDVLKNIDEATIKELFVLEGRFDNHTEHALNEFSLAYEQKNIEYDVDVDGKHLEKYFGLSLLAVTPTGSLALSRSIGGPIIDFDSNAMLLIGNAVISSKAHHSLTSPLVLGGDKKISLKTTDSNKKGNLYIDGEKCATDIDALDIALSKRKLKCLVKNEDILLPRIHKALDL